MPNNVDQFITHGATYSGQKEKKGIVIPLRRTRGLPSPYSPADFPTCKKCLR